MKNVLIVDDEPDLADVISFQLEQLGLKPFSARSGGEALQIYKREDIHLVISDVRMPHGGGLALLKEAKKIKGEVPFILITGFADVSAQEARKAGAEVLLTKPNGINELIVWVQKLLKI